MNGKIPLVARMGADLVPLGHCNQAQARILVKKDVAAWQDGTLTVLARPAFLRLLVDDAHWVGKSDYGNVSPAEMDRRKVWFAEFMTKAVKAVATAPEPRALTRPSRRKITVTDVAVGGGSAMEPPMSVVVIDLALGESRPATFEEQEIADLALGGPCPAVPEEQAAFDAELAEIFSVEANLADLTPDESLLPEIWGTQILQEAFAQNDRLRDLVGLGEAPVVPDAKVIAVLSSGVTSDPEG